jgi:hypothetical protein
MLTPRQRGRTNPRVFRDLRRATDTEDQIHGRLSKSAITIYADEAAKNDSRGRAPPGIWHAARVQRNAAALWLEREGVAARGRRPHSCGGIDGWPGSARENGRATCRRCRRLSDRPVAGFQPLGSPPPGTSR